MRGERDRGALLYGLSASLLIAGGVWYFRAAPPPATDPRIAGWRQSAADRLPDLPSRAASETLVVDGDRATERNAVVASGAYTLSMICLGTGGQVRVQLSPAGEDSGRAVPCAEDPVSVTLSMGLGAEFFLRVSAETDGAPAVFRWRLDRSGGL